MANRNINSLKRWRTIWGILTLLALGFICYGLTASASAFTKTAARNSSDAYQAGAAIGAGAGSLIFIVCGGLPFILFLVFYLRAGGAIRSEQHHQEMLEAVKSKGAEK